MIAPFVESMTIDDTKINSITNFSTKTKRKQAKKSDHNVITVDINLQCKNSTNQEKHSLISKILKH